MNRKMSRLIAQSVRRALFMLACGVLAAGATCGQGTGGLITGAGIASGKPLTNQDVVAMLGQRMEEQAILQRIRTSPSAFDISNAARAVFDKECLDKKPANESAGRWATEVKSIWETMTNVVICQQTNGRGGEGACGPSSGRNDGDRKSGELSPQPYPPNGSLLPPGAQKTLLDGSQHSNSGGTSSILQPPVPRGGSSGTSSTGSSSGSGNGTKPILQPLAPRGGSNGASNASPSGAVGGGSPTPGSPAARRLLKAELAKTPVRGKVISMTRNSRHVHPDAAIIAVLQKQRQAASVESAQMMKLGIRPGSAAGMPAGPSQPMSTSVWGSATQPNNRTAMPTTRTAAASNSQRVVPNAAATLGPAEALVLECAQDPTMRIASVSGSLAPATFTPIDQYNLYTIRGCSFGGQAPTSDQGPTDWVHLYGGTGSFYGKFAIRFWSDNEIDVSLDESIRGFPDLDNLNLVVKRTDGQETQKGGFKFYAARQTVLLSSIPSSWVKLADFAKFGATMPAQFSSPPSSSNGPGPSAGSAYVSRYYDGQKFIANGQSDYYDFSQLAPGWTTDSFEVDPYPAACEGAPFTITYKSDFGVAWSGNWDGNNISVGLSDTTCSGVIVATPWINYQNVTSSFYALKVWVAGPRGTDPLTGQPTNH